MVVVVWMRTPYWCLQIEDLIREVVVENPQGSELQPVGMKWQGEGLDVIVIVGIYESYNLWRSTIKYTWHDKCRKITCR